MQPLAWLHLLLNIVGLLLWLRWREDALQSRRRGTGGTLLATLKRAGAAERYRWAFPGLLVLLVFLRALGYWSMGTGVLWTPSIDLCALTIPFRSDMFTRMLMFSLVSLILFLMDFYFVLLLLSAANRRIPDTDSWQNQIRAHLGVLERLPSFLKLILPFLVTALVWMGISPLLAKAGYQLPPKSFAPILQQALLIGLASFLAWKYVIVAILLVHFVTSYVYLGNAPFWAFLTATARNLLTPISWVHFLQVGRLDLTPLVGAALVLFLGEAARHGLPWLYRQIPF